MKVSMRQLFLLGADFASSPGRILIDFVDPLIVAKTIATTNENIFVSAYEVSKQMRNGEKSIGGIGARGRKKMVK